MNSFLNNLDNTPLHSSGLTESDSIGSTSAQSFDQRQAIERSRKVIKPYQESSAARVISAAGAQSLRSGVRSDVRVDRPQRTTRASFNAAGGATRGAAPGQSPQQAPKLRFNEPPARGYNPFQ